MISNQIGSQLYIHTTKLVGIQVRDVQIGALNHDVNLQVIGLIRGSENILNPSKQTIIEENDKLIVLADNATDFDNVERALLKNKN